MGRRLAEATNARFTRRTRGDAGLRRFTILVGFFAGFFDCGDFGALAADVFRAAGVACAMPQSG
jgi:hypothetical protein